MYRDHFCQRNPKTEFRNAACHASTALLRSSPEVFQLSGETMTSPSVILIQHIQGVHTEWCRAPQCQMSGTLNKEREGEAPR